MISGVPVVGAPAEIDVTNAGQLRIGLLEAAMRGHAAVVVDMTRTVFCDASGIHVLVRAHQRAVAEGGGLCVAVPADDAVPRIIGLTCLDHLIPVFPPWPRPLPGHLPQYRQERPRACRARAQSPGQEEAKLSPHAELQALSDNALLARLRPLPRGSAGREAICEILVSRYAGLVRSCVRPYLKSPEPAEDLLQVGYVGLLKAINGFDPACGDSLSAYAQPCVNSEIKRYFRDRRWQMRVGRRSDA